MELEGIELAHEMFPEVLGKKIEVVVDNSTRLKRQMRCAFADGCRRFGAGVVFFYGSRTYCCKAACYRHFLHEILLVTRGNDYYFSLLYRHFKDLRMANCLKFECEKGGRGEIDYSVALAGLENVVSKVFENAKFQKCVTHFKRSLLAKVRNSDKSEISDDLKEIFCVEQERYTKEIALKNLDNFAKKWGDKYRFIRNLSNREDVVYYFTFLEFDHRIQRLIYTTNWIENLNKQFRKVLKIRNSMPSDESVLLLLSKVAMDKVDKYLNYPIYQFKFDKILFPES